MRLRPLTTALCAIGLLGSAALLAPAGAEDAGRPEPAEIGDVLPDFQATDRAGEAFQLSKLDRTTADVFEAFAEAVKRSDDVMECHMVAGGFDYLVKARVQGMVAYRAFLSDVILPLPGVRETHTYAVMEEVKNTTYLPV